MRWNQGFTSAFYAYIIDPVTWRETTRLEITGGTIKKTTDGLRNSADLECVDFDNTKENYIRVYLDTEQNGASAHIPLFTGLASSPVRNINGEFITSTAQCFSVLKPAQDVYLERGFYIPAGANGATAIKDLLGPLPAPLEIAPGAPDIKSAIIAENGETPLTMADKILTAINWDLRISGDGKIQIQPKPTEPAGDFNPEKNDIIELTLSTTFNWYDAPNVFRAIEGDNVAIAKDENPQSIFSIQTRGREVWAENTSAKLNSGESLAQYAKRQLEEKQKIASTASYTRRFDPGIEPGDLVAIRYPKQGLAGSYKVKSQTITITHGAPTQEEVEKHAEL